MMSRPPLVLKIGGSLFGSPPTKLCLDLATTAPRDVVIVPGGGARADEVRTNQERQHFSDAEAHRLAILAMHEVGRCYEQLHTSARIVSSLFEINTCWSRAILPIWCPWPMVENAPDLPQDWSVTSDGLAAWLAVRIPEAEVALVKSCLIPADATPDQLAANGIVDPTFARLVNQHKLNWQVIDSGDQAALTKLLASP
jgi:5-(aminomethyl)-3-furanmethanol phosphate kinase